MLFLFLFSCLLFGNALMLLLLLFCCFNIIIKSFWLDFFFFCLLRLNVCIYENVNQFLFYYRIFSCLLSCLLDFIFSSTCKTQYNLVILWNVKWLSICYIWGWHYSGTYNWLFNGWHIGVDDGLVIVLYILLNGVIYGCIIVDVTLSFLLCCLFFVAYSKNNIIASFKK